MISFNTCYFHGDHALHSLTKDNHIDFGEYDPVKANAFLDCVFSQADIPLPIVMQQVLNEQVYYRCVHNGWALKAVSDFLWGDFTLAGLNLNAFLNGKTNHDAPAIYHRRVSYVNFPVSIITHYSDQADIDALLSNLRLMSHMEGL